MNFVALSYISLIIISIYFLVRGADLVEETFVYFARKLNISTFFLGFAVLGTISSLPELSVAINSSRVIPELSIGNLLGSTLVVMTLVIGIASIKFGNINFKGRFGRTEMTLGLFVILLSVFSLLDSKLTTAEGIVMILAYILLVIEIEIKFRLERKPEEKVILNLTLGQEKIYKLLFKTVAGIMMIMIASSTLVEGVKLLGDEININAAFIGLFVLGIGTNSPELALLLRAKNFDQTKLVFGDLLGSVIFNTPTLGILAILSGGTEVKNFISIAPVMALIGFASILFWIFGVNDKQFTKHEGYLLCAIFLSLLVSEVIIIFLPTL